MLSFLMRDIKWLRLINMSGGLISLIYAILTNTMPVVVLNASLILINAIQFAGIIIKEQKEKSAKTDEPITLETKKEENL